MCFFSQSLFLLKKRAGLQVSFLWSLFQCLFQALHWCISPVPLKCREFSNGLYGFMHRKIELFHCSHGHSWVEIVKGVLWNCKSNSALEAKEAR